MTDDEQDVDREADSETEEVTGEPGEEAPEDD